jgi:hypothetical protein
LRPNPSWRPRSFNGHQYGRPYHPPVLAGAAFVLSNQILYVKATRRKHRIQYPPFAPDEKISDLKKEKTILDSTEDQSHQDHHLIHYTPLVLRERLILVRLGIDTSIPSWFAFDLIFNYCGLLR